METTETTTHLIQNTSSTPYMAQIKYSVTDTLNNTCDFKVMAIIDTGSPVSLIKEIYVQLQERESTSNQNDSYCGINSTPLTILGTFQTKITVNDIDLDVKFLIVPDTTMTFVALLGRDFISSPIINVSFEKNCVISKRDNNIIENKEQETFQQQIMHIEYIDKPTNVIETLNINKEINFSVKEQLEQICNENYIVDDNSNSTIETTNTEMTIALKHEQPISYRPRRLAFSDKEKLRKILDDLLKNNINRPSNSPYASPILVHKKRQRITLMCRL